MRNQRRKVFIYIYAALVLVLLVSCKKVIFTGNDDPLPTTPPTVAVNPGTTGNQGTVQEPVKGEQSGTPTQVPTATPTPGETVQPTDVPTPTVTPSPTPTEVPVAEPQMITAAEAKAVLLMAVGAQYDAEQTEAVNIDDSVYYLFTVSDAEHVYTPQVAVNAKSKEIFYFYSQEEIVEFVNFPPDNLESAGGDEDSTEEGFTSEDAVALLKTLPAADLGLPVGLSEYTILVDEWTTMVYGLECYCVNAYVELENRKQLMGVYFVATDGSAAYRSDMGDFVLIY